ncbi:MAG: hypothetical protein NTY98_22355 [Verrucomicrobia bacterium]|nr:hypothetical protein [Verrucomicrobiota bacterium]
MSQDDEYFRVAVSAMINRSPDGERIWNERVIPSTFKDRRIGVLLDECVAKSIPSSISTPFGVIPSIAIPFRCEEIRRVLIRITKGFLFLTHPEVESGTIDYDVVIVPQFRAGDFAASLDGKMAYFELGNGIFRMWRGLADSDLRHGVWYYLFYNSAGFGVTHKPK